ncbi:phosphate transporter (Pho88) [Entomophthora muscae]|uniref:Phosphate transporter (Pho88) n=1 Tax=Entomophthora muscae TaxID=34485 RepID=A0ACC2TAS8_9FUNG|nr:phosphate transporter (Pho88) [Entomophthora muscae]
MAQSMTSQLIGIGLVLGLIQVAKRLDLENPAKLPYLRAGYATSQAIVLGLLFFIYSRIQAANDQTELKYEEKKPMSQDPPTEIVTTVRDYDIGELKKQIQSTGIGFLILCVLHLKFGYVQPLFLQSILPVKSLLETNLAKVHIFGKEATGDLKRPWIAASMFDMPQEETEPAADSGASRHGLPQANISEVSEKDAEASKKDQ